MSQNRCSHRRLAVTCLLPFVFSLACIQFLSSVSLALAQTLPATTYLVKFTTGAGSTAHMQLLEAAGATETAWLPKIDVAVVQVGDVQRFTAAVNSPAGQAVVYVEADSAVAGALEPTDPDLADDRKGYGQAIIETRQAWDVTTGSGATIVALLDTGLNLDHPEFAGRIVPGYDFVQEDADPMDASGHGTHVAGIIAAGLDGKGTAGVCPGCRMMPIQVLDANQHGMVSTVVEGIYYAVDHGARILNLSITCQNPSASLRDAVNFAYTNNVIVVAAAGNDGSNVPRYPAAFDHVIAVGATDETDTVADFSNQGDFVDVVAPGRRIYSTAAQGDEDGYNYMSGTSMATAFVSGLAALALSERPELTPDDLSALITLSSQDLGAPGKDPTYGFGRINAYRTISATYTMADLTERLLLPIVTK